MRLLKLLLVALVVSLVGTDILAKQAAEKRFGTQLASSIDGVNSVDVEIDAFPFIPALLGGHFDALTLEVPRISRNGVRISNLQLRLNDIDFEALDVFLGSAGIGVAGAEGRAHLTGRAITRAFRRQGTDARVSFRDGETIVTVSGHSGVVDEVGLADGVVRFELPTGPMSLELPTAIEGVTYAGAEVIGGRLVLEIELEERTVEF